MKIDSVVIKETKYISFVTLILSVLMQAVFLVLKRWNYTVFLGNLLSSGISVFNFFLLALFVQKAVSKEEKEAKNVLKLSQTYRMLMLIVVIGTGVLLPWFDNIALIIPLFFTRVAIGLSPILRKSGEEVDCE